MFDCFEYASGWLLHIEYKIIRKSQIRHKETSSEIMRKGEQKTQIQQKK